MTRRRWLALAVGVTLCGCSGGPGGHATKTYRAEGPVGMVAAAGRVWTVEANGGELTGRAHPSDPPVRVPVGSLPLRAVYDGRLIWVSVFGADRVVAVDPSTAKVARRVRVAGQPEGLVSAFGAIWVVRQQAALLSRISPDGTVGPSYRLGNEPRLVAANATALFVSNFGDGAISRVDPRSGKERTSGVFCTGPQDIAATASIVWVACTPDDKVFAIDAKTLKVLGQVSVAGEPDAMVFVGSRLYVVTTAGPALVELATDPKHPTVRQRTTLGKAAALFDTANVDAAVVNGTWWVSSPSQNRVIVSAP